MSAFTAGSTFAGALESAMLAAPAASTMPSSLLLPVNGRFTSEFGPRTDPITGRDAFHHGLDIAAPAGSPVRAAAAGVVSFAGTRPAYGNVVVIDHAGGYQTMYAHQRNVLVSTGTRVLAGDVVGSVGSTGRSTGPHLHFEMRANGEHVDPRPYLRAIP